MDILLIDRQPTTGDPNFVCSNYRQISFGVIADTLVGPTQPMYCDIYIYGVFYKTLSATTIEVSGGFSYFRFDIQDALQESMDSFLNLVLVSSAVVNSTNGTSSLGGQLCSVQCLFRGSTIVSGILIPNPTVPIQATATTSAVSGTGTACIAFLVLNSTILPNFKNIFSNDLETELTQKQQMSASFVPAHTRVYPLSNQPSVNYNNLKASIPIAPRVFAQDNGQFPLIILQFFDDGVHDLYNRTCHLILFYFSSDLAINSAVVLTSPTTLSAAFTYYIPYGLEDIITLVTGPHPTLPGILTNPANNMYYTVAIFDDNSGHYVFFTPLVYCGNTVIERERLWFQNNLGNFDQLTFIRTSEQYKVTSTTQFEPYTENTVDFFIPNVGALTKGVKRYNVRGNSENTFLIQVRSELLEWLKELFLSPFIMRVMTVPAYPDKGTGGGGTAIQFEAIEILDATYDTIKSVKDAGINYQVTIKTRPAIDYITLRN